MTKANEIRELDSEELRHRVGELKEELFNLRFQLATGQLDNHTRISQVKRDVARMHTILRERDFQSAEQTPPRSEAERDEEEETQS